MTTNLIYPDWPAPKHIKAVSTTRQSGFSTQPYSSFNLATHVGDEPDIVAKNRDYLSNIARLPESPRWLNQVHGTHICESENWQLNMDADAIISHHSNHVCAIMTADCLPLLLCNQQGDKVAAIHAGWRGLAAGIIEKTVAKLNCRPDEILVWLGPAIGPSQFEVGIDVYEAFSSHSENAYRAFEQTDVSHYLANIYLLATQRLNKLGISAIFGGKECTASDNQQFFSYRRDGITGRMASLIWISDN